ncbi:MAG: hypothetical protein JNL54_03580 [Kineosporiaceae bacterium]|nr:hypothetical protein [Kineosporiaceae bacterium]
MSTLERRRAARANQRAAAFVRFQMAGDAEAMQVVLTEAAEDEYARLAFVTALASLAAGTATSAFGRDGALTYFQSVATNSAVLSEADNIDDYFA